MRTWSEGREILESRGIRRRGSKKSGFRYEWPDGRSVGGNHVDRIGALVIPPAWKNVRIAPDNDADLQVIGTDARGRTQYLYREAYRRQRDMEKFVRIVEFAETLPRLRRRVSKDLRGKGLSWDRVAAGSVRLLDQAFFRVGNERSAREDETFGLTTILPEHVRIEGDDVHFEFTGKWKKTQQRGVRDPNLARLIEEMMAVADGEVFKYERDGNVYDLKGRHVNDYIQQVAGPDFSAKDFRTWAGTLVASTVLAMLEPAETQSKRKRQISQAVKSTAEILGNTPAVCRSSYICPRLLVEFSEGRSFEGMRLPSRRKVVAVTRLSAQERALVTFLRETIADRRSEPRDDPANC